MRSIQFLFFGLSLGLLASMMACKSSPAANVLVSDSVSAEEALSSEESKTGSLEEIVLEIDGQKVGVRGAAVYLAGTSTRYMELSSDPLPCERFDGGGRGIHEGEKYVSLDFRSILQPDGSFVQRVGGVTYGSRGSERDPEGFWLGEPDEQGKIPFAMDRELVFEENDFFNHPEMRIKLRGRSVANFCDATWKPGREPRPQDKLLVSVGGRQFSMRGAWLGRGMGTTQLYLTSGATNCRDGSDKSDVKLQLGVTPAFAETNLPVYVGGDVMPSQFNVAVAPEKVMFSPAAPYKEDGQPVTLRVDAEFEVDGYKVRVKGEVQALNCL